MRSLCARLVTNLVRVPTRLESGSGVGLELGLGIGSGCGFVLRAARNARGVLHAEGRGDVLPHVVSKALLAYHLDHRRRKVGAVGVVVLGAGRKPKRGARREAVHVPSQVPRDARGDVAERLAPLGAIPGDGRANDSHVVIETGGVPEAHAQRDLAILAVPERGEVVAHRIVE